MSHSSPLTTEDGLQLVIAISRARSRTKSVAALGTVPQIGCSPWQAAMLVAIAQSGGCTCTQLAQEHGLDAGGVTRMVDRLETSGLVVRCDSLADRRVQLVSMTAKGEQSASVASAIFAKTSDIVLQGLPSNEIDSFKQLLCRMLANAAN